MSVYNKMSVYNIRVEFNNHLLSKSPHSINAKRLWNGLVVIPLNAASKIVGIPLEIIETVASTAIRLLKNLTCKRAKDGKRAEAAVAGKSTMTAEVIKKIFELTLTPLTIIRHEYEAWTDPQNFERKLKEEVLFCKNGRNNPEAPAHSNRLDAEQAKERFLLLLQTDFSQLKSRNKDLELYHYAYKQHAHLLSEEERRSDLWIKIDVDGKKYSLPRNLFAMQSPKYRAMLNNKMAESASCEVQLEVSEEFVQYLETGYINISGENVLELLDMADREQVYSLQEACELFLHRNLEPEDLVDILRFALRRNMKNLIWLCVSIATESYRKGDLPFEFDRESEEGKILEDAKDFADYGLSPYLDCENKLAISLTQDYGTSASPAVVVLANKRGYKYNTLANIPINNQQLQLLAPALSECDLYIKGAQITFWPASIKAKKIILDSCYELTRLEAPKAERIECVACDALSDLDIPMAKKVYLKDCAELTRLEAPKTEKIEYLDSLRYLLRKIILLSIVRN